jgi:uncharacterized membrane protein
MNAEMSPSAEKTSMSPHPFRRSVLRGLAVLCPPLLTILIFVWAINTTKSYFLEPVTAWAREGFVWFLRDTQEQPKVQSDTVELHGRMYHQLDNGTFIPEYVYARVQAQSDERRPTTADGYYRRYVDLTFLRPHVAIPFFLAVFILLLYFLGKFMAIGIGGIFAGAFDRLIGRVPGVRGVYSAVKQVSDFLFTTGELQFTRIVAVEYPRKGIWSLGFVTSESMAAICDAAGEPVLAVLVPCSPMPVTGCTITVRKSECIDLNLTFDQACQFIVSCGVVVPPPQLRHMQSANGHE